MTDLLGPEGPPSDEVPDGPTPDAADEERITEIGSPEPVDPRSSTPAATAVGIVALLLVLVIGLWGLAGLMTTEPDEGRQVAEIVVPRVAGRPLPEAQAQLERLGLIVDVRYEPNEVAPVDVVVDQEPIAGARLEVGEQVVLVVSDGPAVWGPGLRRGERCRGGATAGGPRARRHRRGGLRRGGARGKWYG